MNDVQVVPLRTSRRRPMFSAFWAGPTSPLKGLLVTVEANTNLMKPAGGRPERRECGGGRAKGGHESLGKIFGNKPAAGGRSRRPRRSRRISPRSIKLVAGPPGRCAH